MIPTLVIVGRPNVGKSTLFNRLTRSRQALVADIPGLTRDRHYGRGVVGTRPFLVVDTGGFEPVAREGLLREMARQTKQAIDEADVVLWLVDAREGLQPQDHQIALELRKSGRRIWLVVNKAEGLAYERPLRIFTNWAWASRWPSLPRTGRAFMTWSTWYWRVFPRRWQTKSRQNSRRSQWWAGLTLANPPWSIPFWAKSASSLSTSRGRPGTASTSTSNVEASRYTLIDTAGVRRQGNVEGVAEKFSVIKTLQAIEDANVVVLVLDITQQITDQDAHLAGFILEAGRAMVVAINKGDAAADAERDQARRDYARKLNFLGFAEAHQISARSGTGLEALLQSVKLAYASAMTKLSTPKLTRILHAAVEQQSPPRSGYRGPSCVMPIKAA